MITQFSIELINKPSNIEHHIDNIFCSTFSVEVNILSLNKNDTNRTTSKVICDNFSIEVGDSFPLRVNFIRR